jgi:hypothetical protein
MVLPKLTLCHVPCCDHYLSHIGLLFFLTWQMYLEMHSKTQAHILLTLSQNQSNSPTFNSNFTS